MTLTFAKSSFAMLFALFVAALAMPNISQAQGIFRCTTVNGPGPGEVLVRMEPQFDLQGRLQYYQAMCEAARVEQARPQERQQPAPPPRRPTVATDRFFAVAWHPDASEAWTAHQYLRAADARRDSLAACTRAMGAGCTIATSGSNGTVTIFQSVDGSLSWTVSSVADDVRRQISRQPSVVEEKIAACEAQGNRCVITETFHSVETQTNVGEQPADRKRVDGPRFERTLRYLHGAIAWTGEGRHPESNRIWVSTGQQTRAAAESAAMALCQQSMTTAPTMCRLAITNANGVMIVWTDSQRKIQFARDIMPPFEFAHYDNICKAKRRPTRCTLKYLFVSRDPGEVQREVR